MFCHLSISKSMLDWMLKNLLEKTETDLKQASVLGVDKEE